MPVRRSSRKMRSRKVRSRKMRSRKVRSRKVRSRKVRSRKNRSLKGGMMDLVSTDDMIFDAQQEVDAAKRALEEQEGIIAVERANGNAPRTNLSRSNWSDAARQAERNITYIKQEIKRLEANVKRIKNKKKREEKAERKKEAAEHGLSREQFSRLGGHHPLEHMQNYDIGQYGTAEALVREGWDLRDTNWE